MIVLGIDPGESTGWAFIRKEATTLIPLQVGVAVGEDSLNKWLDRWEQLYSTVDSNNSGKPIVVCEDFILRPKFNNQWTQLPTSEVIGACKRQAYLLGWRFHKQQPFVLEAGCKLMGIPYAKGRHLKHEHSALAHAAYLAQNGIRVKRK